MRRFLGPVILGLMLTLTPGVLAQTATATKPSVRVVETLWEHWYMIELAGTPAGWLRETVTDDGTHYRTEQESTFRINRGPVELEIAMMTRFRETHAGEPIELHFAQDMSLQKVDTVWTFEPDRILSVSRQGGQEVRTELPRPTEPWLTPMGVHRYLMERMEAEAETITYKTIDGENGVKPYEIRMTHTGDEAFEHEGRPIPVTVWSTRTSIMPSIVATSRVSSDGHLFSDEVVLPFGKMVTRSTTKKAALAAAGGRAPELMVRTFVPSKPPIRNARGTARSRLRLQTLQGEMPSLPTAGAQRVELSEDGRSAILNVDRDQPQPAEPEDLTNAEYLEASSMANGNDALVKKLTKSAVRRASSDPMERAETLRRFVNGHISAKALDTAFATASETARTRTGDCSEHGVLLCAMLRADGIPARVATGLVYADSFAGERDIFGWHMWTQALIDGRWVDFDATLPVRYDAVHVLTGTSSLAEGSGMADMASMMLLIGNLEIEVLELHHADSAGD